MEDYIKKLNIPDSHQLVQTNTARDHKNSSDTDTDCYNELDGNGNVVAEYIIKDSTSMYPPFGRSISHEKKTV